MNIGLRGKWGGPIPFLPAAVFLLSLVALPGFAQPSRTTTSIRGFVRDHATGTPLELANVALVRDGNLVRGTVTNRDGLYRIPSVEAGRYAMHVTYVGYETYVDTLDLEAGRALTHNVELIPIETEIEEVVIQSERTGGAARVTAGQQTVRPADIQALPAPDLAGDLATFLTSQPGVVSSGDRGGQLYIRGGEPSQNLVMLDGMTLYQPFHLLGFYSAFSADILSRADVYAGGFGSKFGQRMSSVIDVWTREGNKRQYTGSASISPFIATAQIEGPVIQNKISVLGVARQSLVDQVAEHLMDRPMPYNFGDVFGKIQADLSGRSRLSISGITTHDRGTLAENLGGVPAQEIRWGNQAFGARFMALPRIVSATIEIRGGYSRLQSELGAPDNPERRTSVTDGFFGLDATFLNAKSEINAGWSMHLITTRNELGGTFQNVESRGSDVSHFAMYLDPDFIVGPFRIRPGARLEFYTTQTDPVLEPRLRMLWKGGIHQISTAAGIYHQQLVGVTDQRDAASVFTAWMNVQKLDARLAGKKSINQTPSAIHGLLGYRITPSQSFEWSIEGFYKDLNNLFVPKWSSLPRMSTELVPANGRAYGFDTRMEVRRGPFTAFVNYGYSTTRYAADQAPLALWYGEEALNYRPPHDRRHQVNTVLTFDRGPWQASVRWEFGSGLPYSSPLGFDGFVMVDDVDIGPGTSRSRRVIYERPYNAELPTYHRLDASVERSFSWRHADLTLLLSAINTYDRRNIFYVDVFTLNRADQLPFVPAAGIRVTVK